MYTCIYFSLSLSPSLSIYIYLCNGSVHSAGPKQGLVGDHGEAIEGNWRHGRPGIKNWTNNCIKIDPKWSQSGPGGRHGVFENQQKNEMIDKTQTEK